MDGWTDGRKQPHIEAASPLKNCLGILHQFCPEIAGGLQVEMLKDADQRYADLYLACAKGPCFTDRYL